MKLGILWSGGKDSAYTSFLAKKYGYELACLISIIPKNQDSFMFHPSSAEQIKKQAKVMSIPLVLKRTIGKKEIELIDLKEAIKEAKEKYKIQGILTGAMASVYQASRVQKICNALKLECFNPLWQKNPIEHLHDLLKDNFTAVIVKVSAQGLDNSWIGRILDKNAIDELIASSHTYKINPAGEGGEYESFVLNCPLFKHKIGGVN
ncbi:MAG: diphthine--ammonia ligase [Nanoarchaeota archaeon]